MAQATFSGIASYKLDVDAALVSQSGTTSKIYWRLLVIKTNNHGHTAWGNTGSNGTVDTSVGRLWSNGNISYNFQNGSTNGTFMLAEGHFDVQHRSDGNAEYFVNAALNLVNIGSASAGTGWRSLPRIQTSTVPPAPTPRGFSNITQTSIRYSFSDNGNGGSGIQAWQIGYGTNPNNHQFEAASGGITDIGNLTPGTTWYFWSRGRNANGWGPWSPRSQARTIAGARVKHGGVWREAIPYVKVNGVWRLAQPYVKTNGSWRKSI